MSIICSLLLLISLLHATSCDVYTVTPDDHYYPNTTCHHCHNLQHYLLNITKYFTSNTQLLFLPGLHHLHTHHLIIQNVYNISLIGSTANGITPVSTVQIHSRYDDGIVINSTVHVITVKNFVLTNEFVHDGAIFRILNCCNIQLHNMMIDMKIIGHNMMGRSNLSNITGKYNGLYITFDDNVSVNACAIENELNVHNYKISFATINIDMTHLMVYLLLLPTHYFHC